MINKLCSLCGGCPFRSFSVDEYRARKLEDFIKTTARIKDADPVMDTPIFIEDNSRRRADMAFLSTGKSFKLGFNVAGTHDLVDVDTCLLLCPELNALLPKLRAFLNDFCTITQTVKIKKKVETFRITEGSVRLLQADNGIDIILDISSTPGLEHRLAVAEFVNSTPEVLRVSWSVKSQTPETVAAKMAPELYIAGYVIDVPPGVFLQATKTAETAMIEKVMEYLGQTRGKIADLFCGLGTFTYPLAKYKENEILSVDSFAPSLDGLKKALNRNQIHNVKVLNKNLFKYPLDGDDLTGVKALIIDPPRAGAHDQCRQIANIPPQSRPEKIVFVSCNPQTFVYDATLLVNAGYKLERITLVDQFVYSKHQELIALFTMNPK